MTTPTGAERIERAIRRRNERGEPAIAAFLTAGYPDALDFVRVLESLAAEADVVEVGVPFSDPMADGPTIQRASRGALEQGVSLRWILERLGEARPQAPVVLMSYLNPLLAFGFEALAEEAEGAGVCGFIVPDLPLEEAEPLDTALQAPGLALIPLVSPVTADRRVDKIARGARGFVYAVTVTGITGGKAGTGDLGDYLGKLRAASPVPVMAGFGIREASQVAALAPHADGVIVGTAMIEAMERGEDPAAFVRGLRG